MTSTVKVITSPDILFDQTKSVLVVQPGPDLKKKLEEYLAETNTNVNVYIFSDADTDIKWLLTVAKIANYVILDIDNASSLVAHFMSYLVSFSNTYYKTEHMKAPWDLLNQNRFYDFPNFESETE